MPRMSKKRKQEWALFLNERNRITYNELCRKCSKGFVSSGGFTVMKGSKVSDHLANSFQTGAKSYYELRRKLEADGTIAAGVFTRNYEFSAPSAASAVVLGRASNGKNVWKTEQGLSLNNL